MHYITAADLWVLNALYAHRTDFLTQVFMQITQFGRSVFIAALAFFFAIYLLRKFKVNETLYLFVTLAGTFTTVYVLKLLVHRARPLADIAYYIEKSLSFPSGHSAISAAFYGSVAAYFYQNAKTKTAKTLIVALAALVILLIGFSRLYLGVHYLSDVLGGYLIGLVWLYFGQWLLRNSL